MENIIHTTEFNDVGLFKQKVMKYPIDFILDYGEYDLSYPVYIKGCGTYFCLFNEHVPGAIEINSFDEFLETFCN